MTSFHWNACVSNSGTLAEPARRTGSAGVFTGSEVVETCIYGLNDHTAEEKNLQWTIHKAAANDTSEQEQELESSRNVPPPPPPAPLSPSSHQSQANPINSTSENQFVKKNSSYMQDPSFSAPTLS